VGFWQDEVCEQVEGASKRLGFLGLGKAAVSYEHGAWSMSEDGLIYFNAFKTSQDTSELSNVGTHEETLPNVAYHVWSPSWSTTAMDAGNVQGAEAERAQNTLT